MGAAMHETEVHADETGQGSGHGDVLSVAPDVVEVRRHAGVAAGVGLTASAVAIAYLGRATQSGSALDWAFVVAMGLLGCLLARRARRRTHPAAGRRRAGHPDPARVAPGAGCRGPRCTTSSTRRAATCCTTAAWSWCRTTSS